MDLTKVKLAYAKMEDAIYRLEEFLDAADEDYYVEPREGSPIWDPTGFAVRLVKQFEGNTTTWHGEPGNSAYGILGWQGDLLAELQQHGYEPTEAQQVEAAEAYYRKIIEKSASPRGIRTAMGRAFIFDCAVNHGANHEIFVELDRDMGLTDAEPPRYDGYTPTMLNPADVATYLQKAADKRIELRRHLFPQYPGLLPRYRWWQAHAAAPDEGLKLDPLAADPLSNYPYRTPKPYVKVYGSPVDPNADSVIPEGWLDATGFNKALPHVALIPARMRGKYHSGIDLNRRDGRDFNAPVYAVADGEIIYASEQAGYGWGGLIVIRHADGARSRYGHVVKIQVLANSMVKRGQHIANIGRGENNRYDPHLHFDMPKALSQHIEPLMASYYDTPGEVERLFRNPVTYIASRM